MSHPGVKTILLVEDDPITAEAETRMLRRNGYSVLNAGNGPEAIEAALGDPPVDLVLIDMDLGSDMDGAEAARAILAKRRLPLVFLTAHTDRETMDRIETITRYGFVNKNSGNFVLLSTVDLALRLFAAHEETRVGEEKYRFIAENSTDVIWVMNREGRLTYVSPSIERIAGYTPDEVLSGAVRELAAEQYTGKLKAAMEEEAGKPRTERSKPHTAEITLKHRDGTTIDAEVTVGWLFDRDGKLAGAQGSLRDVSRRKRMESNLEIERAQLLSVFDSMEEAVYVADLDTFEILFANRKMMGVFGKPLTGGICFRELQGFDAPCPFCTNDTIRKMGSTPYRWEYHNPLVDRHYQMTDRLIRWPDGRDVRLEVAVDITERRNAEERLEETIIQNRAILEAIPDLIFIFDRNGVFLSYNELIGADRVLLPPDQFLNQNIRDVLPPEISEPTVERLALLFETGKPQRFEYTILAGNRREYYESRLVKCGAGKALGMVRDITEQRQTEEELIVRDGQLNALFERARDSIFIKDADLRYVRVNAVMLSHLGMDAGEVIGKRDADVFKPGMAEELELSDRKALAGETVEIFPELPMHDGTFRLYHTIKMPLVDSRGRIFGMCGIARDITQLKEAEEHMAALVREKETLLKETYHRVKNNFQSIRALLNLQAEGSGIPEVADALLESANRIDTMAMVHERLYRSSDLESIDLKGFLSDLAGNLVSGSVADDRYIPLTIDAEEIRAPMETAIPCGLAVNELVTNSVKHAFPAGWQGEPVISLSLKREEGENILLSVGDNGKGLPPGFEIRESKSLGLSLIVLMAEQLRGRLLIESGEGARFTIRFPLQRVST